MKRFPALALITLLFAFLPAFPMLGGENAVTSPLAAPGGGGATLTPASTETPEIEWKDKVVVIPVKGVIIGEPFSEMPALITAAVERAEKEGARLIILEIDSPGGEVGACDKLSKRIFEAAVPTIALVVHKAVSGGAMVASAAGELVMTRSARIGDIQPMQSSITGANNTMDDRTAEKIEVDIRTIMKVYAEGRKRPPAVFAAMVSRSMSLYQVDFSDGKTEYLDGHELKTLEENIEKGRESREIASTRIIKPEGNLLELTAQQAVEYGIASEMADSAEAFFASRGITDAETVRVELEEGSMDLMKLIPDLNELGLPIWVLVLLGVFLIVGVAGIVTEFHSPGAGIPAAIGIIGFVCFFTTLLMYDRGSPVGIIIFLIGIGLLVVEIMVLPGFGVAGVMGILGILVGLFMSFTPDWKSDYMRTFMWEEVGSFTLLILVALIATIILIWAIAKYGSHLPFINMFTLSKSLPPLPNPNQDATGEENSAASDRLRTKEHVGRTGTAVTTLRPAGKVRLDSGELLDVVTDGTFVESGRCVKVLDAVPGKIVVAEIKP